MSAREASAGPGTWCQILPDWEAARPKSELIAFSIILEVPALLKAGESASGRHSRRPENVSLKACGRCAN